MSTPFYSVKQFIERNPAFTNGGIRHNIFNEKTNGLKQSGGVIRNGRKVLINEAKFFQWLEGKSNDT